MILTSLAIFLISLPAMAQERKMPALGVGYSNQLRNNIDSLSFKMHKSRSYSFGGVVGLDTGDTGGWGAGLKIYRNIFQEPQLLFYGSFFGGLLSRKTSATVEESGFQFDATLGTEFSFSGLSSIGFSFEFGISASNLGDFSLTTVGRNFLVAGVHFYL